MRRPTRLSASLVPIALLVSAAIIAGCSDGKRSENDILTFTLAAETGAAVIDPANRTVTVTVANGTPLTSLAPDFTVSEGATASPASGETTDFSAGPVTYTVTAEDGSARAWTCTVNEAPSTSAEILSLVLAEQAAAATIDAAAHTVAVVVVHGTSLAALAPTLTVSAGATVAPLSETPRDFSAGPLSYEVTAEDGTTKVAWTLTVTEAPSDATDILTFTLAEQLGSATLDSGAHTITATVVVGTNLSALAPTVTVSAGATVSPASGVPQNFSSGPVAYTVTAEDGTTQQAWAVTVDPEPATVTTCSDAVCSMTCTTAKRPLGRCVLNPDGGSLMYQCTTDLLVTIEYLTSTDCTGFSIPTSEPLDQCLANGSGTGYFMNHCP